MHSPINKSRSIYQMAILMAIAIVFVFVVLYLLFASMNRLRMETSRTLIDNIAGQYESSLKIKIDGDLRTLETLASLLPVEDVKQLEETLISQAKETEHNTFITVGYVDVHGEASICYYGNTPLLHTNMQDYEDFQRALQGEIVVTELVEDPVTEEYMSYYLVPVKSQDEVVGVLFAGNHVMVLNSIIEDPILSSGGIVHLIHANGDYILEPRDTLVPGQNENAFETFGARPEVLEQLQNHEDYIEPYTYQNEEYLVMFKYLDINDWYLLCIIPLSVLGINYFHLFFLVVILGIVLLVIFALFAYYLYRTLTAGSRRLSLLAYHDTLTGLFNTYRFKMEVRQRMAEAPAGVVVLNIYHFRFVNELLGYAMADEVLITIGRKLKDLVDGDRELVARDTKDHFLLYLQGDRETLKLRLAKLMADIRTYYHDTLKSNLLHLNAGVKMIESAQEDVDALISHALFALDGTQKEPDQDICFYDASLQAKEDMANFVEIYMYEALEQGDFKIFLQPQFDMHTHEVIRAEALVRWQLQDGTYLQPDQFIPVFEKNGFCCELDLYMFERVCQLLDSWHADGRSFPGIAINQTRLLFYRDDYVSRLKEMVTRYHVDPKWITIEVIESLMIDLPEKIVHVVDELHRMGFRISLDDFGHGYSNFNTLQNYHVDELKLDRGFLSSEAPDEKRREMIVGGLIRLSRELKMETVMEGIENQADENFVKIVSCDIGQGFFYDKPLSIEAFEAKYRYKS